MAVVAGLIRARRNKTGPALPAARALPVRVVADPLSADSESVRAGGACHDLAIERVEAVVSGHVDPGPSGRPARARHKRAAVSARGGDAGVRRSIDTYGNALSRTCALDWSTAAPDVWLWRCSDSRDVFFAVSEI